MYQQASLFIYLLKLTNQHKYAYSEITH